MIIFNKPYLKQVDTTIGDNPNFRKYKANNFMAFRVMYEILNYDGDINAIGFDEDIKSLLEREGFGYKSQKNCLPLGKNLKRFLSLFPRLKIDPIIYEKISNMLIIFHKSWKEYGEAFNVYADNEHYPIYMDVNKFLDDIFDDNGKLKHLNILKTLNEYYNLALAWREEINSQYKNYINKL